MSLHVIATAGHVDHGKSSLVLRLTGTDPDRFEEEKRRGLTIDLGFAWFTLPSGREVGFVDVPGHERFVRNMLAGVGSVRLVLFVVAADEGWKPQSEEHLDIIDLLGVDGAVVALTKADLVDADALPAAEAQVREKVAGTALEDAPIIACSSTTGVGVQELVAAMDEMLADAPTPDAEQPARPRQFIDRVFTIRGAGTVVTGTLTGGSLRIGDEVEVLPEGVRARVRGLQSHKRSLERAEPASRVAVNLTGVEREELRRGDALVRPGQWRTTSTFEARVRPVRGQERPLSPRGAYKVHAGSAERDARLRFFGDSGFARIRLSEPLVLDVFDRFVLRETGRSATVGGGIVLDVEPPLRPGPDAAQRLAAREGATREELAALLVAERGTVRNDDLLALTGARSDDIPGAVHAGDRWIAEPLLDQVGSAITSALADFHKDNPMQEGADLGLARTAAADRLTRARASSDPGSIDAIFDELQARGLLARSGSTIRLASHEATGGGAEMQRLLEAAAGPTPPSVPELVAQGFDRGLVRAAIDSAALVRIAPDLVVTADFAREAEDALRSLASEGRPITVSAFRERVGTSRKYAVPLLEHFDRRGVTRREGDRRVLRQS